VDAPAQLDRLLRRASSDPDVLAVLLFGSTARGEAGPGSDVDVCLVLAPRLYTRGEIAEKRVSYLGDVDLDVQVLQDLPLHVRRRVLKEGSVLFCRDEEALYDVAFATMRAFERFKRVYDSYLSEVAGGGS